jgi:hypothetical protein
MHLMLDRSTQQINSSVCLSHNSSRNYWLYKVQPAAEIWDHLTEQSAMISASQLVWCSEKRLLAHAPSLPLYPYTVIVQFDW